MKTDDDRVLVPQPGILDIAPYVGGKSKIDGVAETIKLSSNENPFGPSGAAREAFESVARALHRYPSADHSQLRETIGQVFNLDPERIICGAGSDEIFTLTCQAYSGVGDEVIVTEHGFSMHKICALAAGATPVTASEIDRRISIDHVLDCVTDKTRIIFLANPGNPAGTFVDIAELEDLIRELPSNVAIVLDGAYAEYADFMLRDQGGYDGGAALVDAFPNVIMTRTFSKVFGLGAARIGWGYAQPDVIDILNRVRGPFNVNAAALAAAAAALKQTEHTEACLTANLRLMRGLHQFLAGLGLGVDESYGNFLLVRFEDEAEADAAYQHLMSDGIITRQVKGYGFPEALRITIGTPAECSAVVESMTRFMKAEEE
ncbi:MAG: histidinol-phosphate transaminase [Pseudomonadota bacterium]